MTRPLVKAINLKKGFQLGQKTLWALKGVSLEIFPGEVFGLVGESGCGKSTLGKTLLRLEEATSGKVMFDNKTLTELKPRALKHLRREMQLIFQDPFASLNPRMTVLDIVAEGLDIHGLAQGRARIDRVAHLLSLVGLGRDILNRYPHEFSGGQRQRIGIARALAPEPKFIVCDEPISALDLSIQAQVVNLLKNLRDQMSLTYLFIAHDLAMVRHISDRVGVMHLGQMCEVAPTEVLYSTPRHPYTQALLASAPLPDPIRERRRERIILPGDAPSPLTPPTGCVFHTRCASAMPRCRQESPVLREVEAGTRVACHLYDTRFGESLTQRGENSHAASPRP